MPYQIKYLFIYYYNEKEREVRATNTYFSNPFFLKEVIKTNIMDIPFPYYRNVPNEDGSLKVIKEWVTLRDYINNLHYNSITRSPC